MDRARTPRARQVPTAKKKAVGARPRLISALALAALLLLGTAASAQADSTICSTGSGAGQCTKPNGVAADFESGHIYVADEGNNRIDAFQSDGTSLGSLGAGQLSGPAWVAVDNSPTSASRHDIWVTTAPGKGAEALVKKFEPNGTFIEADSFGDPNKEGTGECEFKANDPIAVGPEGHVYVGDAYKEVLGGSKALIVGRVIVFDSSGNCLEGIPLTEFEGAAGGDFSVKSLAVDSTGHIYLDVVGENVFKKYSPTGSFEFALDATETEGIAVDAADNLFVKQRLESKPFYLFSEYSPSGAVLKRFGYQERLEAPALAAFHSPGGDLISSERGLPSDPIVVKYRSLPAPGPVIAPRPCEVKAGTLGNHKATLIAEVNPEGKSTTVHFEYITAAKFAEDGGTFGPGTEETEESEPVGADFELHEESALAAPLIPETEYHCRAVATNADGSANGEAGFFTTKEPLEIGDTTVSEVSSEEATLNATVNPLGILTTGFFEYVEEATYLKDTEELGPEHGFDHATKAPNVDEGEEAIEFGAGEEFVAASTRIAGLEPSTAYRFRFVVTDSLLSPAQIFGPTEALRTFSPGEGLLPDGRAWELVSPGLKNSAEVAVPKNAAGFADLRLVRIEAAAGSGETVTYTSWTSFGKAEGAPSTSQYLSKRTASGWSTENISPFGIIANVLFPAFHGFTPELDFGIFKTSEPPLTADCRQPSPGTLAENIYLRDNRTGELRCLDPEVAGGPEGKACLVYGGASEDGGRAFIAGRPEGGESFTYRLYESTPSGIAVVSVLPNGEPAPATQGTQFGPPGLSLFGAENCQATRTRLRNAISADGTKAFWSFVPEVGLAQTAPGVQVLTAVTAGEPFRLEFKGQFTAPITSDANAGAIQAALEALSTIGAGNVEVSGSGPFTITFKGALAGTARQVGPVPGPSRLYVRVNGTETVQLDALPKKEAGKGPAGDGVFWAASSDGSVAYFTDTSRLLKGSKAEAGSGFGNTGGKPDLYRYELGQSKPLTDLTEGAFPGDVKGVVGASDDGSYVYFVAGALLDDEFVEPFSEQGPVEGADNLYLYHEGKTTFIATLSPEDSSDWDPSPRILSARVSPDGRHLAFLSVEAQELAGYDNEVAEGVHCQYELTHEETTSFVGSPLCTQAFIYDAAESGPGTLTCASCNPSGARPLGPALLPGWSNGFEGPRYLSDNGQRLFFQSWDALLPADVDGKSDVYEYERPGEGSCSASNPGFDPKAGGCHFLITSGKGEDESFLIGASANGRDAFFSTRQKLTGWDLNENYDVYDAREGGGFPESPVEIPCEGEGCKPPAITPPPSSSSATPSFNGPHNPQAKKPKPHHRKKHKDKKGKKHHKAKKTNKDMKGRAGR